MDLLEVAQSNRSRLMKRDAVALRELLKAYRESRGRLRGPLADAAKAIKAISGTESKDFAVYLVAIQSLFLALAEETDRLRREAAELARARRREEEEEGENDAWEMLEDHRKDRGFIIALLLLLIRPVKSGKRLPADSLEVTLAGQLSRVSIDEGAIRDAIAKGKPLRRSVLDELGKVRNQLVAVVRGQAIDGYRTSEQNTFIANPGWVEGWRWMAALDLRTCLYCIAMHGTVHRLGTPMLSHRFCRCVQVPVFAFEDHEVQSGSDWFDDLDGEDQQEIVGPLKYQLLASGDVTIHDLIDTTVAHGERSVKSLVDSGELSDDAVLRAWNRHRRGDTGSG